MSRGQNVDKQQNDETQWITSACAGDLASFNNLVLFYQARVYNLCLRILSDADGAADATQETFISAYRAIGRFRGEGFQAWLLRIASNTCLDMLRSRKRRPSVSLDAPGYSGEQDEGPALQLADLDPSNDPEELALRSEIASTVEMGLQGLPDDQRIAIVLVDVQGLSYEEAAQVTGANIGTVKSRISRARGRMRDYLREQGIIPGGGEP